MTRKKRMLAAIRGEDVDQVPFATYNLHPYVNSAHTRDPSYRELLDLVVEKAGMVCKCGVAMRPRSSEGGVQGRTETTVERSEEQTVTTRILHTPRGDLRSVTVTPKDQPSREDESLIKTDEDIERYMSLPFEPCEYDVAPVRTLYGELGDRGLVYVYYSDPMYDAARLFDYEDFVIRCLKDIQSVQRLVDHQFERILEHTRNLAEVCSGYDVIFHTGGPEVATPPMLPPAVFRKLVTPYQAKLIEVLHDAGYLVCIHCHGRVRQVLDEMVRTGTDVLEPIEPPDQGDISLAELLERVGDRLCLMGHIQDQEFHTVPPGTMTQRVEAIAELVNGRTRYIMTPTCTPFQYPAAETFLRNYTEWIHAADRLLA